MYCPNCGTKNADHNRYCFKCGNPLPTMTTASPSQAPVQGASPGVAVRSGRRNVMWIGLAGIAVIGATLAIVLISRNGMGTLVDTTPKPTSRGELPTVALIAGPTLASTTISSGYVSGKIAFRHGCCEMYGVNLDGSGLVRLATCCPQATWSPDGTRIASFSAGDTSDIFVMNADGTGMLNLTDSSEGEYWPVWSPNGEQLAFSVGREFNRMDVYVVNADGTSMRNLTNHRAGYRKPAWSPDGNRIAFGSNRDGNREIYVMDADGSNVVQLTHDGTNNDVPKWSPDGARIFFWSDRGSRSQVYNLFVMSADGSGVTQLTNSSISLAGELSPDFKQIVFAADQSGNSEIYVMMIGNSEAVNVTNHPANDYYPTWSPDGTQIAFSSNRDGNEEIYVMNADGTDLRRLTNDPLPDDVPTWQP